MQLEWKEINAADGTYQAEHQGRRGHVFRADGKVVYFIDGGDVNEARDVEAAKRAVEIAFGLHTHRAPTPMEAAAITMMAEVETAGQKNGTALRVGPDFQVTTLAARIVDRAPAEVRAQLQERAAGVARYVETIRALAQEGGDPAVVEQMLGEAAQHGREIVEAALEVIREHERARAFAETRKVLAKEEVARADAAIDAEDAAIERLKRTLIKPICEAIGTGETRRVEAMTGKVSLKVTSGRVEIDDDALDYLPAPMIRIRREPDKAAIGAALREGAVVPGARLVRETKVEVRG